MQAQSDRVDATRDESLGLQEISTLLIQEGNLRALYERVLGAAVDVMSADMASIQTFHPEQNELRLLAWRGFHPESAVFWDRVQLDSASTCGVALLQARRIIVPDTEACEFMFGTSDLDEYRRSNIRAVQSTPLVARSGRLLGMISTHWREPHQPTDRKLRSLDVLARQAADLIERGETEAALRESEQRFHWLASVVESSDDAIVSKNLNGDIRSWNAGAERLFGYAAKEMIGEPITILVPPSLQNEERLILEKIGRGERTDHYETVRQRKDGSPVLISLTVSPVKNAEGEIIGASKIARDMSERKRAQERESVLMAELSHMNRVATAAELTASIAHEVNQPLTGIATSAGAALRWLRAKPPETRRAEVALEQVVAATHRAGDIVGSLRMMFNKNIRSSARVDLNHLITTVLALVRADLQSNGIQLEEYLNEIPLGEGDAVQLQQVILNVVVNAIEAMRSTQLRTLKVNSRRSNPGKVYVSIEDTGSGIDPPI